MECLKMSSIAPRPRVTGIHSIALRVPCYAEAIAFYRDVWLLEDMGERDDSHAFRTACADHDNLLLSSGEPGIVNISLTVATREDLLSLERKIETSSHVVYALSEADLAPGEAYGLVTTDPDGRQIRLVVPTRPDRPCEAVADSLAPQNIGHVVLWTPDSSVSEAFYGLLGFSVTDRTHLGMSFLKCGNEDHHSLALVGSKTGRAGLQHLAFDVGSIDNVMRNFARLRDLGVSISWGVGRHGPGNNVFSYYQDPAGNFLEYYGDMQKFPVDEDLETRFWGAEHKGDVWGVAGAPPDAFRQ